MPYVNIQITREGATVEQKAELIQRVTDLLVRVLNKNPATTFVVIQEIDMDGWGVEGMPVTKYRRLEREAVEMGNGRWETRASPNMSAHAACGDEAKTVLRWRSGGDLTKRGRHLQTAPPFRSDG